MKTEIEMEIDGILDADYSAQENLIFSSSEPMKFVNEDYLDGIFNDFYADDIPAATGGQSPEVASAVQQAMADQGGGAVQDPDSMDFGGDLGGGMDAMGGGMGDMGMGGGGGYQDQNAAKPARPLPDEEPKDVEKKLAIIRKYRRLLEILDKIKLIIENGMNKVFSTYGRDLLSKLSVEISTTTDQINYVLGASFDNKEIGATEEEYNSLENKSKVIAQTVQSLINAELNKKRDKNKNKKKTDKEKLEEEKEEPKEEKLEEEKEGKEDESESPSV